jgi:hypothetical protein
MQMLGLDVGGRIILKRVMKVETEGVASFDLESTSGLCLKRNKTLIPKKPELISLLGGDQLLLKKECALELAIIRMYCIITVWISLYVWNVYLIKLGCL